MNEPRRSAPPPFPERPAPEPRQPLPVARAVVLALLFGPLGLAFTSILAAICTGFLAIVVGVSTYGAGLVFVWIFCGIIAFVIAPRPHADPPAADSLGEPDR